MTTEIMTTIARPYAMAAFEYALADNALSAWESMLQTASVFVKDSLVQRLLASPHAAVQQISELFCDALKSVLDEKKKNFIRLLAENKRLLVLPEILNTFDELRAQHEKTMTVEVMSAIPLDAAYQQKISQALTNRLHKQVSLNCNVDPSLIAGVMIRAGDMVLDGTVRGKLNRLLESL